MKTASHNTFGFVSIKAFFAKLKDLFQELRHDFKTIGIKATFKKHGWKLFAVFFFYYLIRDSILYILIPSLIGYSLWN